MRARKALGYCMTKTEILQRWYDEVWSKGNLDAISEMLGEDIVANGIIPALGITRGEFGDLIEAVRSLLGPIKVELAQTVEQGDWLAARYMIDSEALETGEPVHVSGQVMARFKDGRIAESHYQFDFFSMFEQLGQLPPDSLPVCLTGQKMRWR